LEAQPSFTSEMARVKRSFTVAATPQETQRRFAEEIVPTLHRLDGFVSTHETPGLIVFSDGVRDSSDFGNDGIAYVLLRRLSAHRLKAAFVPTTSGTEVCITGRASRELRRLIYGLGQPNQAGSTPTT
jgi:hypothetical protein